MIFFNFFMLILFLKIDRRIINLNKIKYILMNNTIIPQQIPIQEFIPQEQLNQPQINQNIPISSDQIDKSKKNK